MTMSATNTLKSATKPLTWYAKVLRPKSVSIKPKPLGMKLDDATPTYWFNNNPFLTHFLTAFSAIFPEGESFMIHTVRLFRADISGNKALHKDCGGFIGQEAHHSNEHSIINDFMVKRGVPVDKLEAFIDWWVPLVKGLPEKDQMAITGAAEHLTALFGDMVLRNPDIINQVDPAVRPIWVWHAIEEIEHKAVTYDLFEAVDGSYVRRVYGYAIALTFLSLFVTYGTALFMIEDRKNFSFSGTAKGLWWMIGLGKNAGYLRKSAPFLFEYFKLDFHPWKDDNSHLIEEWRPELDRMLAEIKDKAAA